MGDDYIGVIGGAEAAGVMNTFLFGYGVKVTLALVCCGLLYVLYSLGLYAVARRRWIRGSWLAWLPIVNLWVLGSVSDQYQYLVKGRIRARRWTMLVLAVLSAAVYVAGAYCVFLSTDKGYLNSAFFAVPMLLAFVFVVLFLAGIIVVTIFQYICCYDIFRSCDPENRKLFLLLSILYPIGLPLILFAIRKRDGGMPPRKRPAPIVEETEAMEELEEIIEETEGETEDEQEEPLADA